jgi:hypothetical protein
VIDYLKLGASLKAQILLPKAVAKAVTIMLSIIHRASGEEKGSTFNKYILPYYLLSSSVVS